ncbi:MAG: hypothetical protein ACYSUT_10930 [Planctomycetota bacterium]
MRNWTIMASLFVAALILTGCSFTIGGGHGGRADAVTLTEIDAAAGLMMESSREESLKDIASRPHLSADAQVYLIHTALDDLMMESSRRSVILALIKNPDFVSEAKMAILENMDGFMMESSRRDVMEALNRRGHVPSGREAEAIEPADAADDNAVQVDGKIEMTYSSGL